MHDEPRWAGVGLDDVFWFRVSVVETGGSVFEDGGIEDFVKFGGFEFGVAGAVDV